MARGRMSEEMARNKRPEDMADFFDLRADGYEEHMERSIPSFSEFYDRVSSQIDLTPEPVKILDLGCGTGLELAGIFRRVPNAVVTGIDLSRRMLDRLRDSYTAFSAQISLIQGSYLTTPLDMADYDYVVSVQSMHHLLPDPKRGLYARILSSLRPGGRYIEGDYVVSPEEEAQLLAEFSQMAEELDGLREGAFHLDIPFSLDTQRRLLREAGFPLVDVVFAEGSCAVLVAHKGR